MKRCDRCLSDAGEFPIEFPERVLCFACWGDEVVEFQEAKGAKK